MSTWTQDYLRLVLGLVIISLCRNTPLQVHLCILSYSGMYTGEDIHTVAVLVKTALLTALFFSLTNLINYFPHRCNAVAVTENVKWCVTTIWLNEAQSVRFRPHISCLERAGVGMMTPLQMRWWLAEWADHALLTLSHCKLWLPNTTRQRQWQRSREIQR